MEPGGVWRNDAGVRRGRRSGSPVSHPRVHIHYLRPPDRREVFSQYLVLDRSDVQVTLATDLTFDPPIRIRDAIALESGSCAVWFTFPGLWHDIGLFHRADGTFTGTYANILTPPVMETGGIWHTTDLFLDLWVDPAGTLEVLDRDQFAEAVDAGWIDPDTAEKADAEVERLVRLYGRGSWPPAVVSEWPLDRALATLA